MTKTIAVIGKRNLSPDETDQIDFLGVLLAHYDRQLVTTPAAGTSTAIREGFERQGKHARVVEKNVFVGADIAIIYPDQRLLDRLKASNALDGIPHTILNTEAELASFVSAVLQAVSIKALA